MRQMALKWNVIERKGIYYEKRRVTPKTPTSERIVNLASTKQSGELISKLRYT